MGGEATVLVAIETAARRGELDSARVLAQQALAAESNLSQRARLLNLLGGVEFEQGKLEAAEAAFEEVVRLAQAQGIATLAARAANNLASIAHLRGKGTLAVSLYESALLVWRETGDAAGEARTSHNLALVYREDGDIPAAGGEAERAVQAARRSGDHALEGLTLLGRAEVALRRGDLQAARTDLMVASRLSRKAGDGLGLAEVARLAGAIALAQGRFTTALRAARRGYRGALRLGGLQIASECAELSYRACQMLHRARLARRFYRAAFDGYRALGAVAALQRLRSRAGH